MKHQTCNKQLRVDPPELSSIAAEQKSNGNDPSLQSENTPLFTSVEGLMTKAQVLNFLESKKEHADDPYYQDWVKYYNSME